MDAPRQRLDSWKEIASYLKRDVTTVRRWERREGLPVHRHVHDKLGSVYAYSDEVDEWCERRRAAAASQESVAVEAGSIGQRPVLVAVVALLLIAATTTVTRRSAAHQPVHPFDIAIEPPAGVTLNSMALSPAGDQVVLAGVKHGERAQLWIRPTNGGAAPVDGTAGATFPFWSPDGRSLGFFAGGKLKTVDLSTRQVRELADAAAGRGGTWNEHGVILFAPAPGQPLFQVPAGGGVAVPVTSLAGPDGDHAFAPIGHAWPEFLPDGHRFLFLNLGGFPKAHGIYGGDLRTGQTKRLLPIFSSASYAANGYLLYVGDKLLAQRFDPERLELSGKPVTVANDVLAHYMLDHKGYFSVSRDGLLAVRHGVDGPSSLVWLDRSGRELARFEDATAYGNPTLSADGTRAIVTEYATNSPPGNLWMITLATGQRAQLTFSDAIDFAPLWSPVEDRIMFASTRGRQLAVYERRLAGGEDRPLPVASNRLLPEGWTRDARYLTYSTRDPRTNYDIWTLELTGDRRVAPYANGPSNEQQSQVSPDGRLMAYTSDESGRCQVYVQDFPTPGRKVLISTHGGGDPRWAADGRELFYISEDRKMMAVPVTPGPAASFGVPRALFDIPVRALWNDTRNNYDVSPDGQRFLAVVPRDDPRSAFVTLIVNWPAR